MKFLLRNVLHVMVVSCCTCRPLDSCFHNSPEFAFLFSYKRINYFIFSQNMSPLFIGNACSGNFMSCVYFSEGVCIQDVNNQFNLM